MRRERGKGVRGSEDREKGRREKIQKWLGLVLFSLRFIESDYIYIFTLDQNQNLFQLKEQLNTDLQRCGTTFFSLFY